MWNNIYNWLVRYNTEITWFLTGWFAAYLLVALSAGNLVGAAMDLFFVVINIALYKRG